MSREANSENDNSIIIDSAGINHEDMKITIHCHSAHMTSFFELKKFTDEIRIKYNRRGRKKK